MEFETIIGLEVHAQMNTKTKMFCGCDNDAWGKEPNTVVCPVCMGHPGTLPVPNRAVIEKAIRSSRALKCTVNERSHFDRKNYFYPDLPAGYQISQYKFPLASNGMIKFSITDPKTNKSESAECRILRLHIENDAGKLTHRGNHSLCDYNRAGTPLMEIVTEPDLRSARAASAFADELRRILIAAGSSEADMFKGMMRFDASISLRPKGDTKLYPRIEIKNLNSFKALEKALTYQEKQLKKLWEEGKQPTGETTVGWIDDEERTQLLRDKESAADYRYFPEPDIPPLVFTQEYIASLTSDLAKLPSECKAELTAMGLTEAEATMLVDQPALRERFDAINAAIKDAKRSSSIVLTQMVGFLKQHDKTLNEAPPATTLVELALAMQKGTISTNTGKEVLEKMIQSGKSPSAIIKEEGLGQVSDDALLQKLVEEGIKLNPKAIESFKAGKTQALGAIVGWVMKQTKGQADAGKVQEILRKVIA
ncbi:MAG: Asp-tRNA(Asn)/Glu-tRNA(Gln) amidotransferase subunit GatB [Candidatus Peribacteraceae bacterium]|nr:Asp-tRNA(Asn)/Glu-tRNA(Gln) amidotransferase subunit GatB [Candidatus Peribacteraceae bacterium]